MDFQTVLLAEDSAPIRDAIARILGERFGTLHWVGDGAQVLAKAIDCMPHTIVLDISLPGISGLMLLPRLREAHPDTTIVMLTNHANDLYRSQAFARGADAYVLKSRAVTELLPAIQAGRQQGASHGHPEECGEESQATQPIVSY